MDLPTLKQLALRAIVKNISTLEDIGDLPYDFCRPFLVKIVNPDQLRTIETNSPHIAGEDAELWKVFCRRDVPEYQRKYGDEPSNPNSWYKFYRHIKKKDEEDNLAEEAKLREKMMAIHKQRDAIREPISNKIQDIDRKKTRSDHPAFSRMKRAAYTAKPARLQLAPKLMAERKAAAQKKSGLPDDPVTAARLKAQSRRDSQVVQGPLVGPNVRRIAPPSRSQVTSSKPPVPSRTTTLPTRSLGDELFDEPSLPRRATLGSAPSPPSSSSDPSSPSQPSLPMGVRLPTQKAVPTVTAPKKRRREVNVFMPSKKR